MDPKVEEKLLRWYHELEVEDNICNDSNEGHQSTSKNERDEPSGENEDEDPFSSSGSEYEPSSISESSDNSSTTNSPVNQPTRTMIEWQKVDGSSLKQFVLTGNSKINVSAGLKPVDIYKLIVDSNIFELIVLQTNINARKHSKKWNDISVPEMEKFFAIMLYMGLVQYPKISDYWSKKLLYRHCFVRHIMPRNRFQTILRFIHFADNETANKEDRLYKIKPLTDALTKQFKELKIPGEVVSIDESMVAFRGRLLFRQYIPNKASKYGVKIFKLCDESGYTYETEIYKGKSDAIKTGRYSNTVVLNLIEDYLDQGRTLVADNYYNNPELADILLQRSTHNVGTLRKYVKGAPQDILNEKKMKKGEVKGKESNGKVIGNWKDKRSVRFITTRHNLNMVNSNKKNRKGEDIFKPEAIIFYNKFKMGIDLSDQMASYFSVLRRTIRWYHKVAFEYLFGMSVVNALVLYQLTNKNKIQISEFREQLVMGLLGEIIDKEAQSNKKKHHTLEETEMRTKDNRKKRRRCVGCYEKQYNIHKKSKIAAKTTKLVSTFCGDCPDKPPLCLKCFQNRH